MSDYLSVAPADSIAGCLLSHETEIRHFPFKKQLPTIYTIRCGIKRV